MLSIDSSPNENFNDKSYFTGLFNNIENSYDFDYFYNRTGIHEELYYTIKLLRSGINSVESTIKDAVTVPRPGVYNHNFTFDYAAGTHHLNLILDPIPEFNGVDYYYSTNENSALQYYSGGSLMGLSASPEYNFVAKKSFNNETISSFSLSSSAQPIGVFLSEPNFISMDSTIDILVNPKGQEKYITKLDVYKKPVFDIIEGDVGPKLNSILEFNDYKNYFYESTVLGHYPDNMPDEISRNSRYDIEGVGFTGAYLSGCHYIYKFVPSNGFGEGQSAQGVYKFTPNLLFQKNELLQKDSEQKIINAEQKISASEEKSL